MTTHRHSAARRRPQRQAGRQHHRVRPRAAPRRRAHRRHAHRAGSRSRDAGGRGRQARPGRRHGSRDGEPRARPHGVPRAVRRLVPDPELANKLLAQMLPSAEGKAEPSKRRPRVREALSAPRNAAKPAEPAKPDKEIQFDAAMTASDRQRLQHADFNALGASEYRLVERLARDVRLPVPALPSRRLRVAGEAGSSMRACTGPACCTRRRARAAKSCGCHDWRGASSPCRCWCWSTCRARWSAMRACCWPFCMRPRGARAGATCSPSALA
jgi:hypothetical protein